jgi:small redox-active disulfide protein 2
MEIKVYGTGCAKCKSLEKAAIDVIEENSIDANVVKVEDIMEIMQAGIMTTPALAIDGNVVVKGKVPSKKELLELFTK